MAFPLNMSSKLSTSETSQLSIGPNADIDDATQSFIAITKSSLSRMKSAVGLRLGLLLGHTDGLLLGLRLGSADGSPEGKELGLRLGLLLGHTDGLLLGHTDGLELMLGLEDGLTLGSVEGSPEGNELGD